MNDFEDDDDIELNKSLDVRFVILGLLLMISGLIIIAFITNLWVKYVGIIGFAVSFFVMTKKEKKFEIITSNFFLF